MNRNPTSQQPDTPLRPRKVYDADEIRVAITNNKLFNYYQPKVDIFTRQVVGVEALVRWFHPQDGMVLPNQFIEVAETHGLIDDLTQVVLNNALAQTKVWEDAGFPLQISVNLSQNNLVSPDFTNLVAGISFKANVPPQMIDLEVAESCLMEDSRTPLEILTLLRKKRFRLSIDNFSSVNSSINLLRDLPFDEIKIARGFVMTHGKKKNYRRSSIPSSALQSNSIRRLLH